METIVLASNNQHKVKEFKKILSNYEILTLKDIDFNEDIEETGSTFAENALIKAETIHNYLKDKQTFSMNYRDMFNAIKLNPKLYSLLDEGKLVIVDHHIIKNDKKYVSFKNGRFI